MGITREPTLWSQAPIFLSSHLVPQIFHSVSWGHQLRYENYSMKWYDKTKTHITLYFINIFVFEYIFRNGVRSC